MGVLLLTCPRCGAASMTFTVHHQTSTPTDPNHAYATCTCGGCGQTILAFLATKGSMNLAGYGGNLREAGVTVERYWPAPKSSDAPRFTPPNVARFFGQAVKALNGKDWDAAGTMARKALDVATRCMDTSEKFGKLTLAARIEDLGARHLLTAQMKEWAHAIRLDGNDAAHDPDEFTQQEAESIFNFADTFLEYAFTMPGMPEERKKAKTDGPPAA